MAGRPTDEVKRPGDPVWTGYRRHGGGSGYNVHRPSRHPLFSIFLQEKDGKDKDFAAQSQSGKQQQHVHSSTIVDLVNGKSKWDTVGLRGESGGMREKSRNQPDSRAGWGCVNLGVDRHVKFC